MPSSSSSSLKETNKDAVQNNVSSSGEAGGEGNDGSEVVPVIRKRRVPRGVQQRRQQRRPLDDDDDKRNNGDDGKDNSDDDDDDDDQVATDLVQQRKRARRQTASSGISMSTAKRESAVKLGDGFAASGEKRVGAEDQGATAINRLEAERQEGMKLEAKKERSSLLAGPVRGSTNVRVSGQFDFQPDICKDFYETGYCGYGWNCKFAHIREEHKTGYEVEKEWNEEQRRKKLGLDKLEEEEEARKRRQVGEGDLAIDVDAEGIPFACYLCRKPFTDPVVTLCKHYFCERCIMTSYRSGSNPTCPICKEPTNGIFNTPARDVMKKLMRKATATPAKDPAEEERERINREMREALAKDSF